MGNKRVVWKYELPGPVTSLVLPAGAQLLHFGVQHDTFARLWFLVDPQASDREERRFQAVEAFDAAGKRYVGTILVGGGVSVKHLFEVL
jgi:hypothetical protein